jgi:hypothetical protein
MLHRERLHVFVRHDVKPTTDQALLSGIAFEAVLISVRIRQAHSRKRL